MSHIDSTQSLDDHQSDSSDTRALPSSEAIEPPVRHPTLNIVRRIAAAVFIVGGSSLIITSYWLKSLQICRATIGATPLTSIVTCNPWNLSELTPFIAVGLLFLLPDFSELSVANIFTLKREIEAQRHALDASNKRQEALEEHVAAQLATLQTSQSVQQQLIIGTDLRNLPQRIERKVQELANFTTSSTTSDIINSLKVSRQQDSVERSHDPTDAQRAVELLSIWEELRPVIYYVTQSKPLDIHLSSTEDTTIRRWYSLFEAELQTVQAVRNSIAHAREIDSDALKAAVIAARELKYLLRSGLQLPWLS